MNKDMHDIKLAAMSEINKLYKKHKELTPQIIIKAAENPGSPLHEYFEWDDTAAANKWREEQARTLIRKVTVLKTVNSKTITVPAYVRDPKAEPFTPRYVAVETVKTDKDLAKDAMAREFNRIREAVDRAKRLAGYFDMIEDLDEFSDIANELIERFMGLTPA